MEILHVTQPTNAGVKRVVLDLVTDQSRQGLDVAVACPADVGMVAVLGNIGVRHIPWEASRSPGLSVWRETRDIARIVKEHCPKVLHLHSSKAGLAGRLAVRGRIPTVFEPNGWSFLAVNGPIRMATVAWERLAGRWTDVTICVSDAEQTQAQQLDLKANWKIVRNGVDLSLWQSPGPNARKIARESLQLPSEGPLVVCVGRLQRQKGQDLLMQAWSHVSDRFPQATLLLVGDGPDREMLESSANERVKFVGHRNDVRDWMLAADLIVMPSRWEGLSIALLESMACRRAIIATDVSGMRDAAGTNAALLIPPEDVHELQAAIVQLLDTPHERDSLGERARARVEQHFDIKSTCEQVLQVYQQDCGLVSNTKVHCGGESNPHVDKEVGC